MDIRAARQAGKMAARMPMPMAMARQKVKVLSETVEDLKIITQSGAEKIRRRENGR